MGTETSRWLTLIIVGLLTFAIRATLIFVAQRVKMPAEFERALRFVPAAALTAIWVPEVLMPKGTLDFSPGNLRLLAGLVAVGVAWRTKNILLTIGIGMAALLILQFVMGH